MNCLGVRCLHIWFWIIVGCFPLLSACREDGSPQKKLQTDPGIQETIQNGKTTVQLDIDKSRITVADRLTVSIKVTTDENDRIVWPKTESLFDPFQVIDDQTHPPELTETSQKEVVRSWVLEPFLAGEYTISPLRILIEKNDTASPPVLEMITRKQMVQVQSLLPDNPSELQPNDIKPPTEIPRSPAPWVWAVLISGLVLLSIAGLYFWKKNRKDQSFTEVRLAAHEIAFQELEKLAIPSKMDSLEIKVFYQKISNILRTYIENRFGVNAPEQTTEEFLVGMKSRQVIEPSHQPILKTFLSQCDLVKFAKHRPEIQDINNTFETCRRFISETINEESES